MSYLIFGAPGAGKGTQSSLLSKRLGVAHISTGDIMRAAIKAGSPLGTKVKSYLDSGQLVPDGLVIDIIKETLLALNGRMFILDGFPRTLVQAEALLQVLKAMGLELKRAIFLEVEPADLIRRLSGRRVCKSCGTLFHIENKPPLKVGICDHCGGELFQRSDDSEEVIRARLNTYEANTAPLKVFFEQMGLLSRVNGAEAEEVVYEKVAAFLK